MRLEALLARLVENCRGDETLVGRGLVSMMTRLRPEVKQEPRFQKGKGGEWIFHLPDGSDGVEDILVRPQP